MAKIVNDTELIFDESDVKKDGSLSVEVFGNDYDYTKRKRITKVVLPDSVVEIGFRAFKGCSSLKEINIPDSVTKIGDKAFYDCRSLQKVNIPDGVNEIGEGTFQYCESLQEINIPNSVTEMGVGSFSGCKSLQEIHIPDSVVEIGDCAFENCESLQKINIPDGVNEIGYGAFQWCESLKEINIPDSVTHIGCDAFADCTSIQSIHYKGQDITSLIKKYDSKQFGLIKFLNDNDLPLTDDMLGDAVEAKKDGRLKGFLVKTKKRLAERELQDISDNQDCNDFQFD